MSKGIHAFQAITTKYLGPTNARGSRIKASSESGHSVTASYDHALNPVENHARAAIMLCEKLGWKGDLVPGGTKDGYVFVFDTGTSIRVG